jgi:hypothetical protein
MGFLDKMKGLGGGTSLEATIDQHAPEISEKVVTALGPLIEKSGAVLHDDVQYRNLVATPLFLMLPPLVQLLGRERIKWDPIMLDVRNEVIVADGGRLSIRPGAPETVLAIVRRHFAAPASTV